jgi:phosphoribosylaminoimidazolecarboxamide formyltransferase/IMP cyclohydrolase
MTTPVKRAMLSVHDKTGVADLAAGLHAEGWEIISSGGTAATVAAAGVPVTDVAELTGLAPILGHRVVTLHPKVHGGLLADLDDPLHLADLEANDIKPISLLVSSLYPFSAQPSVELIDIGGPAMVRAAAKNHAHVAVVVDPADYDIVLAEIRALGTTTAETRRRLARTAFARTSAYDAAIVSWFDATDPDGAPVLAPTIHVDLTLAQTLRYGENPHQQGARYRAQGRHSWWDNAVQLGGKELSYLNLYDAEAAWRLVHRLGDGPAAVIVKHANPCGVALSDDITTAFGRALEADPVSAFGGIVAVNRPVDVSLAQAIAPVFTEVVVAPSYEAGALDVLGARKALRILAAPPPGAQVLDLRPIDGGYLVQQPDRVPVDRSAWRVVSRREPSEAEWNDMDFAWTVCAAVSSNAIVFVKDLQALGIGAGQQNRVDSVRIATTRAAGRAAGGTMASDAYFPFRDSVDAAAEAGIAAVIHPGGSIRDDQSIEAADEHGMTMVMTSERHFRH